MRQETFDYVFDHLKCYNQSKATGQWNKMYKGKPVKIDKS